MAVERPLTPEERIEQLEKEKADLQRMIKNQHEYEEMKKGTDSIALMLQAFQDSGMSRDEAMEIIKVTIPASMMANSLPGSIFGRAKSCNQIARKTMPIIEEYDIGVIGSTAWKHAGIGSSPVYHSLFYFSFISS